MFERLQLMYERFKALTEMIADPEIIADIPKWRELVKEHSNLEPIVNEYLYYLKQTEDMKEAEELAKNETDKEFKELAEQSYLEAKENAKASTERLKVLLLPKDPDDDKNVIVEIRPGAGGEEAALFGAELERMYRLYCDKMRWKIEEIDMNYTELGGVKEVVFMISGTGVYKNMKFESGVHRVQRVPETESQGRVHTSTVTVAILPEAEDVEVEINEKDLKIDTYRSSGAGGQHVNRTESAIRITHLPTGLVITCQDERSQIKNREKALRVLKSRLYDMYKSSADKKYADNRKMQIGTGDRSERIRTYNFPQGRVTDHRINYTIYSLTDFMQGNIDGMVEALQLALKDKLLSASEY